MLSCGGKTEDSRGNLERIFSAWEEKLTSRLVIEREGKRPVKIVGEYLATLERHDPIYFAEVQRLAKQYLPIASQTHCVVTIPVVGFGGQAERSILKTLEVLRQQEIRREEIDIMCFVNIPPFAEFDQTVSIIQAFSKDNPDLPLSLTKGVIPRKKGGSRPLMGKTRALLADTALVRIYETFKNRPENKLPIIILADSDTESMAPKALQTYIDAFNNEPNIDLIIGELRWESSEYPTALFPSLLVGDELMYQLPQCNKNLLNEACRKQKLTGEEIAALATNIYSSSFTKGVQVNIAFRSEAYAACGGGFDPKQDINELDFLVRTIAFSGLLQRKCNIRAMGETVVKVGSSSKRALLEYLEGEGRAPIQQWRGSFGLRVEDPARIQKPKILGIIPIENLGNNGKEELVTAIEGQINSTLEDFALPPFVPGWYQDAIKEAYLPALASIDLKPEDFSFEKQLSKDGTARLKITIINPTNLLRMLQVLQEETIERLGLGNKLEEVELKPEQIVEGYVVLPLPESKKPIAFDRAGVVYYGSEIESKSKLKTKILKLPI